MYKRFEYLQQHKLLEHPALTVNVKSFLENPEKYLNDIPGAKLYPFIEPIHCTANKPRLGNISIARDTVVTLTKAVVEGYRAEHFIITLQATYDLMFNVAVISRPDGTLTAEFCGPNELPSRSMSSVLFRVARDPLLGTFRYSTANPDYRRIAYKFISKLPGIGTANEREFESAYYEFAITKTENGLKAIFYDYSKDSFFTGKKYDK